jgi:hypothetical protein
MFVLSHASIETCAIDDDARLKRLRPMAYEIPGSRQFELGSVFMESGQGQPKNKNGNLVQSVVAVPALAADAMVTVQDQQAHSLSLKVT